MAELKGQQVQFIGSKSYANAIQSTNGDIHFTTDENGSIVVNGKVYGTVDSNLMSAPTKGELFDHIKGVADAASSNTGSALQEAKNYTDSAIDALDVTDAAVAGKYVSAVSEANGKITVTREDLPTLSGGATGTDVKPVKSVTVNGHTITVTTVAEDLATEANLNTHINDNVKHISTNERTRWNEAADAINVFLADSYMGEQALDTLLEIQEFLNNDITGTAALTAKVNKSAKTVTLSDNTDWTLSTDKKHVQATQTLTTTANDGSTTNDSVSLSIPTTGVNKYGVVALKQDGGLNIDTNGYVFVNPEYKMTYSMWADNATNAKHAETADNATNATNAVNAQNANNSTYAQYAVNAEEADYAYRSSHAENAVNAQNSMYASSVTGGIGLLYNTSERFTIQIENGTNGQILTIVNNKPAWSSDFGADVTIGGKAIATEEYVSYEISKVNQNTGSLSSYVEALSSEVQSISNDVDQIKTYLIWQ